ncbi:MAG TPA: pilus assembly protein, partial [Hyphomicrobiaceae bacterium]|nr:pilus assembly protein [Hyphomicrobiaceae bacterium]
MSILKKARRAHIAFLAKARNLRRSESGIAAIEFAMVVPIMFFLFVGAVEFSQALTVDRRVTQSASATADLVARTDRMTLAAVDNTLKIVEQLIQPYDANALTVAVVSVKASASGGPVPNVTVDWSRNNKGATPYS